MILFHGSQNEKVDPCFGKGEDHHDFGKGFYLTDSAAYHRRAPAFIGKYGVDIGECDVLIGWRADASYFYIVKAFVRGEIDVSCLPQLLKLGGFGLQYVVKTPAAYARLKARTESRQQVRFDLNHAAYDKRDADARNKMRELIADSNFNRLERLFFDLVREERT